MSIKSSSRLKSQAARGYLQSPQGTSIDAESIMRIKNLELRAKVVVEGFLSGLHRSPFHGFSVEFTDYREYSPGDDLRYLDWKLFARVDRYYVKRFEDETNLNCHLLVDMSRSMGYGSLNYTKADYARTTAATLAYLLSLQRDAVGLLTFDEVIAEYIPARYRPGHLRRILLALEHSLSGKSTNLSLPLEQIARTVNRRGLIILFSDLLSPIESLEKNLGYLKSQGHDVAIFRILDPAELNFDFDESTMFFDVESEREIYVDPQSARQQYLARFEEHASRTREACANLGIDLLELSTDQPLDESLLGFVTDRVNSSGRKTHRRSTNFQITGRGD